jgi:N-acetylglutamate synthase-like GNAT family acetyltransferase
MVIPALRSPLVRPARPADVPALQILLGTSSHVHRHLDWRPATSWIGRAPAFVAEDPFGLRGALITPADPPPAAWVRLAAVDHGVSPADVMDPLVAACLDALAAQNVATLGAMPIDDWLPRVLDRLGFDIVEEVATWTKNDLCVTRPGARDIHIRPARADEMTLLEAIETAAFPPRWRHSAETLALAFQQVSIFSVAERGADVVGFQFSQVSERRAHLVRLTVHPAAQRTGVGARLLADALTSYAGLNVSSVSLNTQSGNIASHHLYRAFGFQPAGYPLPVWERPVSARSNPDQAAK